MLLDQVYCQSWKPKICEKCWEGSNHTWKKIKELLSDPPKIISGDSFIYPSIHSYIHFLNFILWLLSLLLSISIHFIFYNSNNHNASSCSSIKNYARTITEWVRQGTTPGEIKSLSNFLRMHVWMFVAIARNLNFECPQLNQVSSLQSFSSCMNLASTLQFCIVYSSEKCA